MLQSTLKLVDTGDAGSLVFNRRYSSRYVLSGRVTAVRDGSPDNGSPRRICSLQMINMSDTGAGVLSDDAVDLETSITIFFAPHGPERGFDLYGKVVRCRDHSHGHELGIRFYRRHAA